MKMREILFRGKRADNGTWEYGYLFCIWERTYLCWGTANDVPNMKEVIPETVGEFTGLTDKNGKRIFEGDILQGEQYPFKSDGKYNYFVEVCYWADAPEFGIYTFKNPKADIEVSAKEIPMICRIGKVAIGKSSATFTTIPNYWERRTHDNSRNKIRAYQSP